jgi:hypothetical protein
LLWRGSESSVRERGVGVHDIFLDKAINSVWPMKNT